MEYKVLELSHIKGNYCRSTIPKSHTRATGKKSSKKKVKVKQCSLKYSTEFCTV